MGNWGTGEAEGCWGFWPRGRWNLDGADTGPGIFTGSPSSSTASMRFTPVPPQHFSSLPAYTRCDRNEWKKRETRRLTGKWGFVHRQELYLTKSELPSFVRIYSLSINKHHMTNRETLPIFLPNITLASYPGGVKRAGRMQMRRANPFTRQSMQLLRTVDIRMETVREVCT